MLKTAPFYPASYAQGYAACPGQSLYPGLWRELRYAIAPGLGPVGSAIRNLVPAAGGGVHPNSVTNDTAVQWLPWLPRRGLWAMGSEQATGNPVFIFNGSAGGNIFKPLPAPCTVFWAGRWKTGGPDNVAGILTTAINKPVLSGHHKRGYHFYINTSSGAARIEENDGFSNIGIVHTIDGATLENTFHTACFRLWHLPFDEVDPPGDIWIDGVSADMNTYGPSGVVDEALTAVSRLHANGSQSGTGGSAMWSSALYFWSRLLEPAEIRLLHLDPLALVRLDLLDLASGEDKPVSLGDIRSRRYEPDPPRKKSRYFKSGKKPVPTVPKVHRMIKSAKRDQINREHHERRMAAHVQAPAVTAGVDVASAITRRYMQVRSTYHIKRDQLYHFYRSNVGPPVITDSPYATDANLAFTPVDTFADGTWYLSVAFFNGVESSEFLPLGPNGETYLLLIVASGAQKLEPPTPPQDVRLEIAAGGVVKVAATYVQNSGNRATEWAVRYTTDGSSPAADNPNVTVAIGSGSTELLEYSLPAQAHGTTVKVRVQVRRDDSGVWSYSLGSSVVTAVADATGPAAVEDAGVFPGGVPK